MAKTNNYGFREVLIDQPFTGKWMEVDMNLGGGHTTFQGSKFTDFAGGFSYKNGKQVAQNRCIYWRTLNDTLELTEMSMNYNLVDNQIRYIFQDSPIVGPITIQETESSVIILVVTVTSINRFIFTHPKRVPEMPGEKVSSGNNKPSIFYQVCNKPQMNFKSFNLYEHAINIPVPQSAACHYVDRGPLCNQNLQFSSNAVNGECFFALSFESGSVNIYKVSRDDTLTMYDLRQANMFTRFFSGFTSSLLKGPTNSTDTVIGMSFYTTKYDRNKSIQLVTLSMNGQLNLWHCSNLDTFTEWCSNPFGVVSNRFAVDGFTDSCMLLRQIQDHDSSAHELPSFVIFIPGQGFKFYGVKKNPSRDIANASPYCLQELKMVDFKDRELIDFSVTSDFIFLLVSNPEEEMEWEVRYCRHKEILHSLFKLALLEPLAFPGVEMYPSSAEPKEFYMDLIFNQSSFNAQTIIKALTMFRKEDDEIIKDKDWESLKITAMNIIYREISLATSHSDFGVADDEFSELSLKFWLMFYNSCVEYHIHTIKPLGLFYESNTKMLCIVKKSRISFLRPTDLLETLYYFPEIVSTSDSLDPSDEIDFQVSMLTKYMEVINVLETIMDETHLLKLEKRMSTNHLGFEDACEEVVTMVTDNDPNCLYMEKRQMLPMLVSKLKELEKFGSNVMKLMLAILESWETDGLNPQVGGEDEEEDCGEHQLTDNFMGSRIGSHLSYKCLKQLLEHRYMIARGTMLLQALVRSSFAQNNLEEEIQIECGIDERFEALSATTGYYALLQLTEDTIESPKPYIKDRGLKVANILKLFTGDHLKPSEHYIDSFWPMKTIESFLVSQIGGMAVRRLISGGDKKSSILACAEAAARALWVINERESLDRPFDDFLISSCQYVTLLKYANFMVDYFPRAKSPSRKLYMGIAKLFLDQVDTSLAYFRSIPFKHDGTDIYFCVKILGLSPPNSEEMEFATVSQVNYIIKVISIFQVFDLVPEVQKLAEDGLKLALIEKNEHAATQMCSLAFKSALNLGDYSSAYKYILLMPTHDEADITRPERKEKFASLRMFVSTILQRKEVEVLIQQDFSDMFNGTISVRDQVEDILFAQSNLSDPLCIDGIYQMLYLYHLGRKNYLKAAAVMYYRAMRIGDKGLGFEALEAQKESYLDVITCLSLVKFEKLKVNVTNLETKRPEVSESTEASLIIERTYEDVQKELELILLLVKIAERVVPNPVKIFHFETEAEKTIECLTLNHYYDDAIKLAKLWDINVTPIVSAFADVCTNLVYNILPESEDPFEYIRNNDISELPNSDTGVIDLAFRLLQSFLGTLEKPRETVLHKEVTLKLLAADIEIPQWLIASYKKRNTAQLLRCYITYGLWEEGTKLALKVIDGALGRRKCDEFDMTIKKISAYESAEPAIPFNDINVLASEIEERILEQPELKSLLEGLNERTTLYCDRILECRKERKAMFAAI